MSVIKALLSGRRLQNKLAIEDDGNKQTWYAEEAYDELATVRKIIVSCSNSRVWRSNSDALR